MSVLNERDEEKTKIKSVAEAREILGTSPNSSPEEIEKAFKN